MKTSAGVKIMAFAIVLFVAMSSGSLDVPNSFPDSETGKPGLDPDFAVNEGDLITFNGSQYVEEDGVGLKFELLNVTLPEHRSLGETVWIEDNIWIFGGYGQNRQPLDDILVFDPTTYTMYKITTVPECSKRGGVALWNGQYVYIFGGTRSNPIPDTTVREIRKFSPTNLTCDSLSDRFPEPWSGGSVAWNGQYAYLFGYYDASDVHDEIYRFDPATEALTEEPFKLPSPAEATAAIWIEDRAYLFGGDIRYIGEESLKDIVIFEPQNGANLTPAKLPDPTGYASAIRVGDDIYVIGGHRMDIAGDYHYHDHVMRYSLKDGNVTEYSEKLPFATRTWNSLVWNGTVGFILGGWGEKEARDEIVKITLGGNRTPISFSWDFNDMVDSDGNGNFTDDVEASGPQTDHAFGDDGLYNVTLTVSYSMGPPTIKRLLVEVRNLSPSIDELLTPSSPREGSELSVSILLTDPGSDDLTSTWDWGDGTIETSTVYNNGVSPDPKNSPWGIFPFQTWSNGSHTYGDDGDYTISITIEDDDGGSLTESCVLTVDNVEPSVHVSSSFSGNENSSIDFVATAGDPGSDDLSFTWDWGDGTTDNAVFYNNGLGPDPPRSPWGEYPFNVNHSISHVWGDNGNFTVTLKVMDDDDGVTVEQAVVTVNNVAPTVEGMAYYLNASFAFRIAGEKWHNVEIYLYEDGTEIGYANITRYPGSPNEQMTTLADMSIDFSKTYSAVVYYTPEDDPINGQIWGATPAWVILEYEDGEERIHHTFNVRHEDTWTWVIDDFSAYFLGHNITFMATASDPGSDDLTFTWDWGDGNTTENVYYNDGVGPDSYPSPEVNPISVTDTVRHGYALAGTYMITLTVTDDDGGVTSYSFNLTL